MIVIRVSDRNVSVSRLADGEERQFFETPVSSVSRDQFDMLHGCGVFTRFYSDYKAGMPLPACFSQELRAYSKIDA